jgi:hypothetical protein
VTVITCCEPGISTEFMGQGEVVNVTVYYSGPFALHAYLVRDLEATGCQVRQQGNRTVFPADGHINESVNVTGARGEILAGLAAFHDANRGPGIQAFADFEHFWQGVVPGEQNPQVHAVERRPDGDVSLCAAKPIELLEDRIRRFRLDGDPRSCPECMAEAERRSS